MKNAEKKETREEMIAAYVEEASKGQVQCDAVREKLLTDLDEKRRGYLSIVKQFEDSYDEDLRKAADALEAVESDLVKTEAEIEEAKKALPGVVMEGDPEKLEHHEAEIKALEAKRDQLTARAETLRAYQPTGNASLVSAAELAEMRWRAAKSTADKVVAGIRANINAEIAALQKRDQQLRGGIWSDVEISTDSKLSELRRKNRNGYTVAVLIQQRKDAEEKAAAYAAARAKTEAVLAEIEAKKNDQKSKPTKKTLYQPGAGKVTTTREDGSVVVDDMK